MPFPRRVVNPCRVSSSAISFVVYAAAISSCPAIGIERGASPRSARRPMVYQSQLIPRILSRYQAPRPFRNAGRCTRSFGRIQGTCLLATMRACGGRAIQPQQLLQDAAFSSWPLHVSSARGGVLDRNSARHCQARTACFVSPSARVWPYRLLLSNANNNHVLAIIRRIKIFVLNEPLAAQAIA